MSSTRRVRRTHAEGTLPVRRRELWAWAMFDFANSGYTTVVITAVFNAYFVAVVAAGAAWATLSWTLALSLSYALIVVTAPVLGAWADLHARKKPLLLLSSIVCILGTAALAWCGRGDVALALVLVVITNTAFGTGENLIAAFLPELADSKAMGRLSSWGWALGYVGGLLVLALCLAWIQSADARHATTDSAVSGSMLITAIAFALASLPTFLLLKERAQPQAGAASAWRTALSRMRKSLAGGHDLQDLQRFMWCIVCYQAGVATVIVIAAIYTQQALGFDTADSIKLILVVNISAALGALAFGWIEDRIGHRATLALTLARMAAGHRPVVVLADPTHGVAGSECRRGLPGRITIVGQGPGRISLPATARSRGIRSVGPRRQAFLDSRSAGLRPGGVAQRRQPSHRHAGDIGVLHRRSAPAGSGRRAAWT